MKASKRGKVKQVQVQLYEDQVEALDKIAEEKEVSRSRLIRRLIDLLIEQEQKG